MSRHFPPPRLYGHPWILVFGVACVLFAVSLCVAGALGIQPNDTASMPRGLWRVTRLDGAVRRGMIITICPPDDAATQQAILRGYINLSPACPSSAEPLLKYVLAVPGDRVRVSPAGISVNDQLVPQTQAQPDDEGGRPMVAMSPGAYRVGPGEVWVYAPETLSWDSRYFGAVPTANVRGIASPVWTFR